METTAYWTVHIGRWWCCLLTNSAMKSSAPSLSYSSFSPATCFSGKVIQRSVHQCPQLPLDGPPLLRRMPFSSAGAGSASGACLRWCYCSQMAVSSCVSASHCIRATTICWHSVFFCRDPASGGEALACGTEGSFRAHALPLKAHS